MNWRASLLGAFIVAAAGLAVGVAVGGKKTVNHVTVTVTRAAASTPDTTTTDGGTSDTSTATTDTGTTGTTPGGGGDAGTQQYLTNYLATQGTSALNNEASGVSLIEDPSSLQLKGKAYQHAVAFQVSNNGEGASETFQMPVAGFTRLTSSLIGLDTLTSARARYRLTIYKDHSDTPNATVLYRAAFHGPSDTHKLDFDTQGATDLVLEWTNTTSEPDSGDNFILADPVLTR